MTICRNWIVALLLCAVQTLVAADLEGFEWFDGKMPAKVPGDFYILRYEHPDGMYTNRWRNGMTRWLFTEVRQLKDGVTVVEDGVLRQEKAGYPGVNWAKWIRPRARKIRVKFVDGNYTLAGDGREAVPEGFTALFNGRDLDGWKGTTTEEWFDYYNYRAKMPAEKRAALQAKADGLMRAHWHVRDGALFFDGLPGGSSLAAAKDYGDFDSAGFGQDPLEALELYKSRVRHVHLKDHPAGAVESAAAMGEGTVPNLEAVKRLRAAGYGGWFTLELFGPRDPFGLCRKSAEYFKRNLEDVEW